MTVTTPAEMTYPLIMGISELQNLVGRENVSLTEADRFAYVATITGFQSVDRPGTYASLPDVVVHVENSSQLSRILKIANQYRSCSALGRVRVSGRSTSYQRRIVVDLKKMNKIVEINPESMTYTAECGIIHQVLEWELNRCGYSTMHLPASTSCATLGGYLAHRGSGVASSSTAKLKT